MTTRCVVQNIEQIIEDTMLRTFNVYVHDALRNHIDTVVEEKVAEALMRRRENEMTKSRAFHFTAGALGSFTGSMSLVIENFQPLSSFLAVVPDEPSSSASSARAGRDLDY